MSIAAIDVARPYFTPTQAQRLSLRGLSLSRWIRRHRRFGRALELLLTHAGTLRRHGPLCPPFRRWRSRRRRWRRAPAQESERGRASPAITRKLVSIQRHHTARGGRQAADRWRRRLCRGRVSAFSPAATTQNFPLRFSTLGASVKTSSAARHAAHARRRTRKRATCVAEVLCETDRSTAAKERASVIISKHKRGKAGAIEIYKTVRSGSVEAATGSPMALHASPRASGPRLGGEHGIVSVKPPVMRCTGRKETASGQVK